MFVEYELADRMFEGMQLDGSVEVTLDEATVENSLAVSNFTIFSAKKCVGEKLIDGTNNTCESENLQSQAHCN